MVVSVIMSLVRRFVNIVFVSARENREMRGADRAVMR